MRNFQRLTFRFIIAFSAVMITFAVVPLDAQDIEPEFYITYLSGFNQIGLLYRLDIATGESTLVAQGVMQTYEWSPNGKQIAVGDGYSIFVIDADGTNVQTVLEGAHDITQTHYGSPTWSPDGTRIAFIEYSNHRQVKIILSSDSEHSINLDAPLVNPHLYWSPDGNSLAYTVSGGSGPEFKVVTGLKDCSPSIGACEHSDYDFSDGFVSGWSPDGSRLAVTRAPPCCTLIIHNIDLSTPGCANSNQQNCAVTNEDSSVATNYGDGTSAFEYRGESMEGWSADGQSILLISSRPIGTNQIYLMDTGDGAMHQLTDDSTIKSSARWSPDGKQILFVDYEPDNVSHGSISVMNADGTDIRVLTEIDIPVWDIQWYLARVRVCTINAI